MKIKQYIIVLLAGVMLPLGQLQAQITSLDELKNDKSYTIRQLPAADNNQKGVYARLRPVRPLRLPKMKNGRYGLRKKRDTIMSIILTVNFS